MNILQISSSGINCWFFVHVVIFWNRSPLSTYSIIILKLCKQKWDIRWKIISDVPQTTWFFINKCFLVCTYILMSYTCKYSNFIESIFFFFIWKSLHINLLQSINFIILFSTDFVYLWVCTLAYSVKYWEIRIRIRRKKMIEGWKFYRPIILT